MNGKGQFDVFGQERGLENGAIFEKDSQVCFLVHSDAGNHFIKFAGVRKKLG